MDPLLDPSKGGFDVSDLVLMLGEPSRSARSPLGVPGIRNLPPELLGVVPVPLECMAAFLYRS